jgi:hypothetical protein
VTDKAYSARRLRVRAGTVVAPGLRFVYALRLDLFSLRVQRWLGRGAAFTPSRHDVRLAG